jgi:hypothetical protein
MEEFSREAMLAFLNEPIPEELEPDWKPGSILDSDTDSDMRVLQYVESSCWPALRRRTYLRTKGTSGLNAYSSYTDRRRVPAARRSRTGA